MYELQSMYFDITGMLNTNLRTTETIYFLQELWTAKII